MSARYGKPLCWSSPFAAPCMQFATLKSEGTGWTDCDVRLLKDFRYQYSIPARSSPCEISLQTRMGLSWEMASTRPLFRVKFWPSQSQWQADRKYSHDVFFRVGSSIARYTASLSVHLKFNQAHPSRTEEAPQAQCLCQPKRNKRGATIGDEPKQQQQYHLLLDPFSRIPADPIEN